MTANRTTLLAQLAPLFGPQTENLAVEALGQHPVRIRGGTERSLPNCCRLPARG